MAIADYIGKYWAGAEVLYGLIITMTFTSMLRNFPHVPDILVDKIILAALFCCIAWGIADGLFYLWERGYILNRQNRIIELSHSPTGRESAFPLIGDELDDTILKKISPENRQILFEKLTGILSTVDERERITSSDAFIIVLGTFLLSAASCIVVVSPFFFIDDVLNALLISNFIGVILLFIVGYSRAAGRPFSLRLIIGFASCFIGIVITLITVALGG